MGLCSPFRVQAKAGDTQEECVDRPSSLFEQNNEGKPFNF